MMSAFGFSVGDFIATIGLITKVTRALDARSGASTEYQYAQIELQALERSLRYLQALQPNEDNRAHVDAIRGMALTCRIPLQEFIEKITKFETTMGAFSRPSGSSLKAFGRKSQWALVMSEEVARLRTAIEAKVLSINLLLATHTSERLSEFRAEARTSHATIIAGILQQRATLINLGLESTKTKALIETHAKEQAKSIRDLDQKVDCLATSSRQASVATKKISTQLVGFRNLGTQLMHILRHLPQQYRETLEQIVQSNLKMYSMLRVIHTSIVRSPAHNPADAFRFEDALGRSRILPYEYFRHKEVFDSFLRTDFRGLPGEEKVKKGNYLIWDVRSGQEPVDQTGWEGRVFPGSQLCMSIFIEFLVASASGSKCPGIGCCGVGQPQDSRDNFTKCNMCGMEFSLLSPSAGDNPTSTDNHVAKAAAKESYDIHKRAPTRLKGMERLRDWHTTDEFTRSQPNFDNGSLERQARKELQAFRRIHLQTMEDFTKSYVGDNDTSHFEGYDIAHDQAKFPGASLWICRRAGLGITKRRRILAGLFEAEQVRASLDIERLASDVYDHGQGHEPEGLVTIVIPEADRTTNKPVSLRVTVTSPGSFQYSGYGDLRLPLSHGPPNVSSDEDTIGSICSICFRQQNLASTGAWRDHMWGDLRPYLCILRDCDEEAEIFPSIDAWRQHDLRKHDGETFDWLIKRSCPFCSRHQVSIGHLVRHLKELALFAFPRSMNDLGYEVDSNDAGSGSSQEGSEAMSSDG